MALSAASAFGLDRKHLVWLHLGNFAFVVNCDHLDS